LSFFSLSNGNDINIEQLCVRKRLKCDITMAGYFDEISGGSQQAFRSFVKSLKLNDQIEELTEFFRLVFYRRVTFEKIGKKFKLEQPGDFTITRCLV
jgi:hypothetical protein